MKVFATAVAVLLCAAPSALSAQSGSPAIVHDLQCLLVSSVIAGDSNANIADAGRSGVMFFGGAIMALDPKYDVATAIKAEMPKLTDQTFDALRPICNDEIKILATQLDAAGSALEKQGK